MMMMMMMMMMNAYFLQPVTGPGKLQRGSGNTPMT
jgi:hypothetical protein